MNYELRPNKAVVRRAIFSGLSRLRERLARPRWSYIGFGSYWFSDVAMARALLGVSDIVSIESDPKVAVRARANAPFDTVRVLEGESVSVLPEALLHRDASVVWLDYTATFDDDCRTDLQTAVAALTAPSVLLLTVNTHVGSYGDSFTKREHWAKQNLSWLSARQCAGFARASSSGPELARELAKHIHAYIEYRAGLQVGRKVLPLLTCSYKDAAHMLTLGVLVGQPTHVRITRKFLRDGEGQFLFSGQRCVQLKAPAITRREKLVFDRCIGGSLGPIHYTDLDGLRLDPRRDQDLAVYSSLIDSYRSCAAEFRYFLEVDF